jgi:hypothetical protein
MAKNKKKSSETVAPFGTVVIPSRKDLKNSLNLWGGSVPSYVQPLRPAVVVNERPFASMFNKNIFSPLVPRPNKQMPNRKLRGYNFSLGEPRSPLVIENADPRFRGSGNTNLFRLHNEDPFNTLGARRSKPSASNKMKEVRWIDMINKPKYHKYTSNPFGDNDRDGILNMFDCRPGNRWYQDEFENLSDGTPEERARALAEEKAKTYKGQKWPGPGKSEALNPMEVWKKKIDRQIARGELKDTSGDNVFDDKGKLKKIKGRAGGRKPLDAKDVTIRNIAESSAKQAKEFGRILGQTLEGKAEEAKAMQKTKQVEEKEKTRQADIERKRQKALLANKKKMAELDDRINRTQNAAEKISLQRQRNILTQQKMDIQRSKIRIDVGKQAKAIEKQRAKRAKIESEMYRTKRVKEKSGTQESLFHTSLERQNLAKRAADKAEEYHTEIYGELKVNPKTGRVHRVGGGYHDKLELKKKLETKIEKYKREHPDDKSNTVSKMERELAEKYAGVSEQGLKNLMYQRDQERDKQKIETKRADVTGAIYAAKVKGKEKIYGGIARVLGTKSEKVKGFAEDTAGLAKKAKKQISMALTGRKQTSGEVRATRAIMGGKGSGGLIRGLTSFGGIGGVSGSVFGTSGGSEIGGKSEAYYGDTLSESEYAKAAQYGVGQTKYTDSGLFPQDEEKMGPGGSREGSGRPEGTYKYGMPINEYKAMKREQEQARRIKMAIEEQEITKRLTGETQMALSSGGQSPSQGLTGPVGLGTSGESMGPVGMDTIGSGGDSISGFEKPASALGGVFDASLLPGRQHSSQKIFPGLHAEARTAKIPWLPKDPVMIREQERLPVYFSDKEGAEYARNNQSFFVSKLPKDSPLVGGVGFQYAGRIKEVKAPQTKGMIMQTQNDGIVKSLPTMKANPWGLMIKNRLNFSESNIIDEDLRGNVISRDEIGGNILNTPNIWKEHDLRATGSVNNFGEGQNLYGQNSISSIGSGRIPEYAREVTGYSVNGVYDAQKSGRIPYPPRTGTAPLEFPAMNQIQMAPPEVTGLGPQYTQTPYQDYLAGDPGRATANIYNEQSILRQRQTTQRRMTKPQAMTLMQTREAAINEQKRLAAEEEYVKQVAVQEGLKEVDALGGKGFAKPAPLIASIKDMVLKKGPSDIEKHIGVLTNRYNALNAEAAKEVEDINPGSPLPLNMMSNAKGNFEDLPVVLKQRVIEEEIYRKQNEEMSNRYNAEQVRYQADLKEQMRQAAAIRNMQMDAAKKAQAAAEQMLAASGSIRPATTTSTKTEYLTGEILDPYYDAPDQQTTETIQEQNIQQVQEPTTYNGIKRKARRGFAVANGVDTPVEADPAHYAAVVPENVPRLSGAIPSGGSYGAG